MSAHVFRGGAPKIAPLVTAVPVSPRAARSSIKTSVCARIFPSPSASRQPRSVDAVSSVGPLICTPTAGVQTTLADFSPGLAAVMRTGRFTEAPLGGTTSGNVGVGLNAKSVASTPVILQPRTEAAAAVGFINTTLRFGDGTLTATVPNARLAVWLMLAAFAVSAVGPPDKLPGATGVQVIVAAFEPMVVASTLTEKLIVWPAVICTGKLGGGENAKSAAFAPPNTQF